MGWEEVKARIPEGAVAACQNAEDNTTVSGNADVIKGFVSALESEGVFTRKVNTNGIAYHSPDMHSVAPVLQAKLDEVQLFPLIFYHRISLITVYKISFNDKPLAAFNQDHV